MYPAQVKPEHIQRYGMPTIKAVEIGGRRLEIVNFPVMPNRARLAREFAESETLLTPAAKQAYEAAVATAANGKNMPANEMRHVLASNPTLLDKIPLATWDEIGRLDGLPEVEPMPVDIRTRIDQNKAAVDFKNVAFDQNTVDTLWTVLTRVRDTNLTVPQPIPHTLLMGPPGTSKSKIARMVAAITDRPFFQIVAEQVSPEVIQAKVTGETRYVGSPVSEAEDLVKMGGLRQPAARRHYLKLMDEKPIKAFTPHDYKQIADLEGLEKGAIYTRPGDAWLAKRYGGELNITEINCLRGDAITLLTGPVLDVYTSDHPNYTVIADANPANEKHHNRFPLPPEIIDRFGNAIGVNTLNHQQLAAAIRFTFTGAQPKVMVDGKSISVAASNFGITVNEKPELASLSTMLTPKTLNTLAERLAKLHMNVESKVEDGKLDRRESERPRVAETTTATRRGVSLFFQGLAANLDAAIPTNPETLGSNTPKAVSPAHVCAAISRALEDYYVRPYSFNAEKIGFVNLLDPTGKMQAKPDEIFNTRELLVNMINIAELSPRHLGEFVETFENQEKTKTSLKQRLLKMAETDAGKPTKLLPGWPKDGTLPPVFNAAVENLLSGLVSGERDGLYVTRDANKQPFVLFRSQNVGWTSAAKVPELENFQAREAQPVTDTLVAQMNQHLGALVKEMTSKYQLPKRDVIRHDVEFRENVLLPMMEKPACYMVPMHGPAMRTNDVGEVVDDPTKETLVLGVFLHHSFAPDGSEQAKPVDANGKPKPYNMLRIDLATTTSLPKRACLNLNFWDGVKPFDVVLLPILRKDMPPFPGITVQQGQGPSI